MHTHAHAHSLGRERALVERMNAHGREMLDARGSLVATLAEPADGGHPRTAHFCPSVTLSHYLSIYFLFNAVPHDLPPYYSSILRGQFRTICPHQNGWGEDG